MNYSLSINGTQVSSSVQSRRDAISKDITSMIESGATTDTGSICPVRHRFAKGLYCREILIPKGVKIIGKIHATEHFNTIVQGECLVITTTEEKRIKAPYTWVTKSGEQKAVLALSDVLWQTYHVTDKTDVDEIEKDVIVDNFSQLSHDELLLGDKL